MKDPLYPKIVAGLEALSNGDLFEACANSLLREKYPYLTWIEGGNDAGFDGTAVEPDGKRVQLICTTHHDVIGNVTASLARAKEERRPSDLVLVATSRGLSPLQKRNVEDRVKESGKAPLPVEDQPNFAELLYHSPRWRMELLGLPGNAPALSSFPVNHRMYLPRAPIGRDAELAAVTSAACDLVVVGQPGSGKTHLLAHAAKTNGGLFLVTSDPAAIADGIREQEPEWIIVDDAFSRQEQIRLLRQIRQDIDAVFRIVAACWPGQEGEVCAAMGTTGQQSVVLEPLPQPLIRDIIQAAGLGGPDALLWELIHQASGKPGLAVTLARLCFSENLRDVLRGRALALEVKRSLNQLAGKEAVELLGFFALAGNEGVTLESAAKAAGISLPAVRIQAESMAMAGILQVVRENRLAVEPARLRQALVAETFCNPGASLDWQPLLKLMPSRVDALTTVILAGLVGGTLDNGRVESEILSLAESRNGFRNACECYARLGRQQSLWVLRTFPALAENIADSLLGFAPREALPTLIKSDHEIAPGLITVRERLKSVREWIESVALRPETIKRRELLLEALVGLEPELKASSTLLSGIVHAFSLRYEWISQPPGQPATITFSTGSVPQAFLPAIVALWPKALPLISALPVKETALLCDVIQDWIYPTGRLPGKVSPEYLGECRKLGRAMLSDIVAAYSRQWAVLRQFAQIATDVDLELPAPINRLVAILFPSRSVDEEIDPPKEQERVAKELATEWTTAGPKEEIIRDWLDCDREARTAGVDRPNLGESIVVYEIAKRTTEAGLWLERLTDQQAPAELIWPIALRACGDNEVTLNSFVGTWIDSDKYGWIAAHCLVRFASPGSAAWARGASRLSRYAHGIGTAVLRNQLPVRAVLWLLQNAGSAVIREVAANLWSAKLKGGIPAELFNAWRNAVIEYLENDYQLGEIAAQYPDLGFEWLRKRINQTFEDRIAGTVDFTANRFLPRVIVALSFDQRAMMIDQFAEGNMHSEVLAKIVGGNLELLRCALGRSATKELARSCLGSPSDFPDGWADRALVLFEYGLTSEDVFEASCHTAEAWSGSMSQHYESRRVAYLPFNDHPDARVRDACQFADAYFSRRRDEARRIEGIAAIRGELI